MKNQYKFYVDTGSDTIEFPVNPKEYTISYPTAHSTYNVLNTGEIVVPRLPSLMMVSWESYFPGDSGDSLAMGRRWSEPGNYVEEIKDAMDRKEICDLVISRYDMDGSRMHDTNISAIITNFETTEKGGETGDVYYKIEFKEYRNYGPRKITLQTIPVSPIPLSEQPREQSAGAPTLCVGAKVIANGTYYDSSYGDKPARQVNNFTTVVSRIIPEPSRPYPILIGGNKGWIKAEQLQVIG